MIEEKVADRLNFMALSSVASPLVFFAHFDSSPEINDWFMSIAHTVC
jgi:hypothetical protein